MKFPGQLSSACVGLRRTSIASLLRLGAVGAVAWPAALAAQGIVITFEGNMQGTSIPLDSIHVENLTLGGDTVLYYPDTTLVLDFSTGIPDFQSDADLIRSVPNPFRGSTEIEVGSAGGEMRLVVHDAMGREVAAERVDVPLGRHRFRYSSSMSGLHIVSVLQHGQRRTLRMVAMEGTGSASSTLTYFGAMGRRAGAGTPKSDRSLFTWQPGDQLRYIGYASNDTAMFSGVILHVPTGSATLPFYFHGAACPDAPTMTDVDGNVYATVQVGGQCWTATNLRTTHYRDGSAMPNVTSNNTWAQMSTGARCSYQNNAALDVTYGQLYNWYAVADPRGVCPLGWHVPSDAEWTQLTDHLGGASVAGGLLKTTTLWNPPNTGATNASGFSAVPAGTRSDVDGVFAYFGSYSYWWSTTERTSTGAWYRNAASLHAGINRNDSPKRSGYCIRCLRD